MMNTNMLHNIIFKDFDMAYPHFERLYRGCVRSPHFKYSRYNDEKCAVQLKKLAGAAASFLRIKVCGIQYADYHDRTTL